jgi:hypothetical protein
MMVLCFLTRFPTDLCQAYMDYLQARSSTAARSTRHRRISLSTENKTTRHVCTCGALPVLCARVKTEEDEDRMERQGENRARHEFAGRS